MLLILATISKINEEICFRLAQIILIILRIDEWVIETNNEKLVKLTVSITFIRIESSFLWPLIQNKVTASILLVN